MICRIRSLRFVRLALLVGVAVAGLADCGRTATPRTTPTAAAVRQPEVPVVSRLAPEFTVSNESFQTFATSLRQAGIAHLELPLPNGSTTGVFTFEVGRRPVADDYLPELLFASGRVENSTLRARITLVDDREFELTIFDDDMGVYVARVAPGVIARYARLGASVDSFGRPCRTNPQSAQAAQTAAASVADLRIVIVIGSEMIASPYHDDEIRMKADVASLVFAANDVLSRDFGLELSLQGTAFYDQELDGLDPLSEVQDVVDTAATDNQWTMDLGHFLDHGGGGEADIGTVCKSGSNARAYSYNADPSPIAEVLLTFLHELGHQLGAAHTFNMASPFRDSSHAYEPDHGTTIMSYALNPQAYFHADSIETVDQVVSSNAAMNSGCGIPPALTAAPPLVRVAGNDMHVPRNTPFEVEALPDSPSNMYRWDEYDRASSAGATPPYYDSNQERSLTRIYPPLGQLLTSVSTWPTGSMNFRVLGFRGTAHGHKDMTVHIDTAAPFAIRSVTCRGCTVGGFLDIRWQPGATRLPPFRVATVRVEAFAEARPKTRVVIASGVPNTGRVVLPIPVTRPIGNVRIVLRAERGIFFALSDRVGIS